MEMVNAFVNPPSTSTPELPFPLAPPLEVAAEVGNPDSLGSGTHGSGGRSGSASIWTSGSSVPVSSGTNGFNSSESVSESRDRVADTRGHQPSTKRQQEQLQSPPYPAASPTHPVESAVSTETSLASPKVHRVSSHQTSVLEPQIATQAENEGENIGHGVHHGVNQAGKEGDNAIQGHVLFFGQPVDTPIRPPPQHPSSAAPVAGSVATFAVGGGGIAAVYFNVGGIGTILKGLLRLH
ncbi:suprabasin isoform X1 [Babesia caballi]|uniref:Suprabasin isoform X1 n=1 Tax=Babesia caballi TaxID=5871 RepID=A0AAV4LMS4_BABCB|nr:suprabasin isoform X1 [Babesia caballi]